MQPEQNAGGELRSSPIGKICVYRGSLMLSMVAYLLLCAGCAGLKSSHSVEIDSTKYTPGVVTRTTYDGRDVYVVCAAVEQDFDNENQTELAAELTLTAKQLLAAYLRKKETGESDYSMAGFSARKIWKDGNMLIGSFVVDAGNVKKAIRNSR